MLIHIVGAKSFHQSYCRNLANIVHPKWHTYQQDCKTDKLFPLTLFMLLYSCCIQYS